MHRPAIPARTALRPNRHRSQRPTTRASILSGAAITLSESDRFKSAMAWLRRRGSGKLSHHHLKECDMKTCLLVIDVQQSFTRRSYFDAAELSGRPERADRGLPGA
jgi:hypothetical protein